jgi:hypothetical protein
MASWRVSPFVGVGDEARTEDGGDSGECANVELATAFGSGSSALAPFDAQRKSRAGGADAGRARRLGELLLEGGVLTSEQLEEALAEQQRVHPKRPLGEILLRQAVVPGAVLVRFLSSQCELELEHEDGFGTGLRRAIEDSHRSRNGAAPVEEAENSGGENVVALRPTEAARTAVRARPLRLGELLIEAGILTGLQLDQALADQEDSGRMLGEILVDRGHVPMITLVNLLAEQLHGRLEQAEGFGTGLRDTLEDRLLDRAPTSADV